MSARNADSGLMNDHRFPWKWYLTELESVPKNGRKVFSTFSCGGGSSMGYKLAGYEVLGNCEIDPEMYEVYKENQHPLFSFNMDIRDFNKLADIPEELFGVDILDGSPPCSVFSMAGQREKGWDKEKVFREGQKRQRLDDLFFSYIRTSEVLKPKVVIAENVEGLIKGNAKGYVHEILNAFGDAGYVVQMFLLDASTMGVPQKRKRVFFVGHRKEYDLPKLRLNIAEPVIKFGDVRSEHGQQWEKSSLSAELLKKRKKGDIKLSDISKRERGKNSGFTSMIYSDDKPAATLVSGGTIARFCDGLKLSRQDIINVQTFPQDYNFLNLSPQYICGMSVPPVMMAHISSAVFEQWLSLIN